MLVNVDFERKARIDSKGVSLFQGSLVGECLLLVHVDFERKALIDSKGVSLLQGSLVGECLRAFRFEHNIVGSV